MQKANGRARFRWMVSLLAGSWMCAAATASASRPVLDHCNTCSPGQVAAKAEQRGVLDHTLVYVLDYGRGAAWRCELRREPGSASNVASCAPASAAVESKFDAIVQLVNQLRASEVDISYAGGNIYDLSGCPACAREWLVGNPHTMANRRGLLDRLAAAGAAFAGQLSIGVASVQASYEANTIVRITLSNDGSQGREKAFCMAGLTGTELVVDVNQCVDSDGNPIPTMQNPTLHHVYVFTSPLNHSGMIERLRSMGRRVMVTGTVTTGEIVRIECSSSDCETGEAGEENGAG